MFLGAAWSVVPGVSPSISANTFWTLALVCLIASLTLALVLMAGFHYRFFRPMGRALGKSGELLQRAEMMQAAEKPALLNLRDGLDRNAHLLDILRLSLDETLRLQASESSSPSLLAGAQARARQAIRDVKMDIASQLKVVRALLAANETVTARLAELDAQFKSFHYSDAAGSSRAVVPHPLTAPLVPPQGEAMAKQHSSNRPLFSGDASESLSWPSDTHQSLISDYKFKDEHTRRRFGLN
jgi:hypothetical protein